MKSIRAYLVIVSLSVICLSNFIAALHGYQNSLQSADQLVEHQIVEKARSLSKLTAIGSSVPGDLYDSNTLFQIWQRETLIYSSNNAPEDPLSNLDKGFHIVSYQGARWRTYVIVDPQANSQIIVGQRFDVYNALVEDILIKAIIPIIWVLPLLGVLVWLIVNQGLKPLRILARRLSNNRIDDFATLDEQQYPAEMLPIVESLNNLFLRLNDAFERERRFSADAAHELRTPLAAIRVGLHNLTADGENVLHLSRMVERMGHTIEQLLAIHQVSSEQTLEQQKMCDLVAISKTTIAEMYSQFEAKQQSIELIGDCQTIAGEEFSLVILLRNLLDNANKYTPENGSIQVTIARKAASVCLLVEDSGPGIPEQEYERVTERFYRLGGDRHSSGVTGSGLGLSIVCYVAGLYHAQLTLSQSVGLGGLAIEIAFPVEKSLP